MHKSSKYQLTIRRTIVALILVLGFLGVVVSDRFSKSDTPPDVLGSAQQQETGALAHELLETLEVKGRAPKTGYTRDEFGSGWASVDGCDMRNTILARSLSEVQLARNECTVLSGVLQDPYTGARVDFVRGSSTSGEVQIDHVVALSDAWQKGAQDLEFTDRVVFANDPLNLLAVDGLVNQEKGDADAASWLPPNKAYRCQYVARQIAVKAAYRLWVSEAEKAAMQRVLSGCGEQRVPNDS